MVKGKPDVSAWDNLISHALSGGGGAMLSGIAAWYWSLRKDKREDRGSEIQALRDTMHELREEVERVRERQIEDEKREDLCRRSLRIVIDALQAARIPVPTLPTWPASRE